MISGISSDKITRAEASAIIYRMATGDVDNRQNDLYKDYSTFVDVNSDDWFAVFFTRFSSLFNRIRLARISHPLCRAVPSIRLNAS